MHLVPIHNPSRPREARLFRNNRSQAVRIPADFELPGETVLIHRDGDRLIIEPVHPAGLLATLATLHPLDPADHFPDIDAGLLPTETVEL